MIPMIILNLTSGNYTDDEELITMILMIVLTFINGNDYNHEEMIIMTIMIILTLINGNDGDNVKGGHCGGHLRISVWSPWFLE